MPGSTLTPTPVEIPSPIFTAIKQWGFEDEFVARILADDIPQRARYQWGRVWVYQDSAGSMVAFGTLDMCNDYPQLTEGKHHTYIPLLAVHPDHRGRGYGRVVVDHLVSEAACEVRDNADALDHAVFLDVYEESVAAYKLYLKCGFVALGSDWSVDPINGKRYRIMAKRVV